MKTNEGQKPWSWYVFDHRQNQIVRNPLPLILIETSFTNCHVRDIQLCKMTEKCLLCQGC